MTKQHKQPLKSKQKVTIITGATATGKSSFALKQAIEQEAVIINADSMQIYRDLDIISARPAKKDMQQVPHKLYGVLDGAEYCNAARWVGMAVHEIQQAQTNQQNILVVGGTGMYIKSLINGLSPIPEIDADIRHSMRDKLATIGNEAFHDYLATLDASAAEKLNAGDSVRMLRAAEVMASTDISLYQWHTKPMIKPLDADFDVYVVSRERSVLYQKINDRFDSMIGLGALDEVRALKERNLAKDLPIMKSLGVPELMQYLEGILSLEDAIDKAKQHSRNYAKRQITWMKNQFSTATVISL